MKEKNPQRIEGNWIHRTDEIQINGVKIDLSPFLKQEWNYLQIRSDQDIPNQDYIDSEPELSWDPNYDLGKKSGHEKVLNLKEE